MRIIDTDCCYPRCDQAATVKVDQPLCDKHLISVYRSVIELAKVVDLETAPGVPRRFVRISDTPRKRREYGVAGVVYFIRFGTRIKIGFTTDLDRRVRAIPHDELLATLKGSFQTEKMVQDRFAHLRLMGEWFSMGDDLMTYIAALTTAA